MWGRQRNNTARVRLFFRVGLSHNSLENYYLTMFAMIQHHKWNLTELEDMLPYERDIYVTMLTNWVQEENERIQRQNTGH